MLSNARSYTVTSAALVVLRNRSITILLKDLHALVAMVGEEKLATISLSEHKWSGEWVAEIMGDVSVLDEYGIKFESSEWGHMVEDAEF